MTRESSGTGWQPESSPAAGRHLTVGNWMIMAHGSASLVYTDASGKRGKRGVYSPNMIMAMGHRPMGPGTWGLRGMLSLEPLTTGRRGYPLLLQTGETADGEKPLIDRQHPHDFFMELAGTYSIPLGPARSVFVYFGLPGEPALGPTAFMHRFSGSEIPEAPLTHHWLDSTHITYGVVTLGTVWESVKLEASTFRGREPDEERWDLETPGFDSYSARLTLNPGKDFSFQASYGRLDSPEQLEPETDVHRWTASAVYNRAWQTRVWQTTWAWGRNFNVPGRNLDAFLLESALRLNRSHTLLFRFEEVEKDELIPEDEPGHGKPYWIAKMGLGYIYELPAWHHLRSGLGAMGNLHVLPGPLDRAYGDTPLSYLLFTRIKIDF